MISTVTRLRYASGYLALGLASQAARELDAIDPAEQGTVPVLGARIELLMAQRRWKDLVPLARIVIATEPGGERAWIALAYALRELNQIEDARAVLLEAEPRHGATSGILHYNLACYECLLGHKAQARRRLGRAYRLEPGLKDDAASDPDLAGLETE